MATGVRSDPDDLAAGCSEGRFKGLCRVVAGPVVGNQRVRFLDAMFRCPFAERAIDLRGSERGAHDVGRFFSDYRRGGIHHYHQLLGFFGDVRGPKCFGREREPGQDIDFVSNDQLLRQALGNVGRGSASVLADDLDLFARDLVAMLLQI